MTSYPMRLIGGKALWWGRFLAVLALVAGGCQSPRTGDRPLAAVEIQRQTAGRIRQVTRQVFAAHGYAGSEGVMSLVFEKPGSTISNLAYGGWNLSSVTVRVEVRLTELSFERYRLSCQAHWVRNAGDAVFRDSQRVRKINRGPYRKMLNEIKARLDATP